MSNRYCPRCRGSFQGWVEVCPDCGQRLVQELPPPSRKEGAKAGDDALVLVAKSTNEPIAMMWAGILENEGIRSIVKRGDLRSSMYGPSVLSACEIHVLASHAEKAKEVLKPFLDSE